MSNQQYLQGLLDQQRLTQQQLNTLRSTRSTIEQHLRAKLRGSPVFYYGGSFGKNTMIRDKFDLDIVAYWPHDCGSTLADIYAAVGNVLKEQWNSAVPKTVAWQIRFQGGFHIDVVPGRAIDGSFRHANLYRRDKGSSMQTSIKIHIDTVSKSGRRDAIRLMKLWRVRNQVDWPVSLALELAAIEGAKGKSQSELEPQLVGVFRFLVDRIDQLRLLDPANSNNAITEELSAVHRSRIKAAAQAALDARTWSQVFEAT